MRDASARFALAQLRWQRTRPDTTRARLALDAWAQRLAGTLQRRTERGAARVASLAASLEALSPQRTLERGYAALIDIKTGSALRSPAGLVPKRRLAVHLAEGIADVTLADVQPRLPDAY